MRRVLFLLSLIVPLSVAQVSDATPASVEGQVVSATTGQPIRRATVQLVRSGQGVAGLALSDDAGKFRVDGVAPGSYRLSITRSGYVGQGAYGFRGRNPILKLDAGQRVDDVVIKLMPQAVIGGYVFDEDGDPFRNSDVTLFRESRIGARTQLVRAGFVNSDMEGHFVFVGLAAGRYYVGASGQPQIFSPPLQPRREPQENYVLTYYPSSLDSAGAVAINLLPGGEFRSAEIRLRKARTYRISGKIVNPPANLPSVALSLLAADGNAEFPGPMTRFRQDTFEFNNVPPGSYLIRSTDPQIYDAKTGERRSLPLFCRFSVTVRDEDVSDLKLEFQPGVQVAGTVKVEGDAVLEPAPIIAFQVASGFASSRSMKIDANRAFELTNLAPDQYRLMVSQLPKGTYVKAIRAGGQVLPPGPIDLTGGDPGPIEILLSPNAADVRGAVRDDKGEPIPSASVALWSKGDNRPPVFGNTDENGAFQLGSIPPGEYFLAASENGELNNPNVRASLEGTATTVTLREGSHETADITLKP